MPVLTLTGRPLPIVGCARVYVCGVTPYDVTHLGHAATFVWADTAVRLLRHLGVRTEVCRNVTDVDDVLFAAAATANARYERLAAVQEYHFVRDMDRLGVRRPDHQPRAHSFVEAVQQLATALLATGAAYQANGGVYLPGADVAARAGLERTAALAALEAAGNAGPDPARRDPLDQPVWAPATTDQPSWPSEWGLGRPGWHAECTAMALATLGPAVDLHIGGADLRYPHHAFEAAAAEAATGVRPFARAWLHVGLVCWRGAKMAKSTGNLVFVSDLIDQAGAPAVRLLLLGRRPGEDWDYEPGALEAAGARLEVLRTAAARPGRRDETATDAALAALCTELDIPVALDVAEAEGGAAARTVLELLGL